MDLDTNVSEDVVKDEPKQLAVADVVTYKDENGVDHNALVTAVHSQECINVVYLSDDATKRDPNGRQIERASSVQKQAAWTAHGRYFTV